LPRDISEHGELIFESWGRDATYIGK
jgi:hypothetical protein